MSYQIGWVNKLIKTVDYRTGMFDSLEEAKRKVEQFKYEDSFDGNALGYKYVIVEIRRSIVYSELEKPNNNQRIITI